mgnify:FL=1|jgi:hypothetical protein
MHNISTLVNIIKQENPQAVKSVLENRKNVNQKALDFLYILPIEGVEITKDDMGMATWFYIKRNNKTIASQFFWNEGEYDAEGNHSLYDEYGFSLK